MNLGVGLGALVGGLIADTDRPSSFTVLLVLDAATFIAYLVVIAVFVPDVDLGGRGAGGSAGYRVVVRNRPFMGLVVLNALLIFGGISGFELLPAAAHRDSGVSELGIGLVFFVNTIVIVLAQLTIARRVAGHRRMRLMAVLALLWAGCWLSVAVVGSTLEGVTATVALCVAMGVFAIGECLHGAVYAPLVTDLAEPESMGRYMALSALSWQVGFAAGPAAGGFLLARSSSATWGVWAALCVAAAGLSVALDRGLPDAVRRSPAHAART
jgi:predicted MFS family arabinose efflux permease